MLSFCPVEEPFLSYASDSLFAKDFSSDKAVKLAIRYWESGDIPPYFKWIPAIYSDARVDGKTRNLGP